MTRKCRKCGEEIIDESLFCPKCGNYVEIGEIKRQYPLKWIAVAALCIALVIAAGIFIANDSSIKETSLVMISDSHFSDSSDVFSLQLSDSDGNPLADRFIRVEIGNNTYTLKTDENGTAQMNFTMGTGTFEIRSYFEGDDSYGESHSTDIVVR